jgi:uncharacterized protein
MPLGVLTLYLMIPGCTSLKEKRSHIKPLLARLHREFNVSAAEIDRLDAWQEALIACALVSNDVAYTQRALELVVDWVEKNWLDVEVLEHRIELR